ncbi:thioesterase family protein [Acetobacter thailandicus]|uniref:thioesterase family protein n=1 Tax=Acetobacter thailandicus TaxID=1502842 RepID=UPI001BAB3330|nr:thioesterase family protein [Acetobacter thailandicus]MBS0985918.1 thioesterase family protein [Acetobacter thailandicus]
MNNNVIPELKSGLQYNDRMTVMSHHTVPKVDDTWSGFKDMPPVFATAMMIGFIEQTCVEALRPYLTTEQRTVGTHVDVSHVAPTPVGMTVKAEVELLTVEGRKLRFRVRCLDEVGLIGEGEHERMIIDFDRFWSAVVKKKELIIVHRK